VINPSSIMTTNLDSQQQQPQQRRFQYRWCMTLLLFLPSCPSNHAYAPQQQRLVSTPTTTTITTAASATWNRTPQTRTSRIYLSSSAYDAEWLRKQRRQQRQREQPRHTTTIITTGNIDHDQNKILNDYNVPSVRDVLGFAIPAIGVWLCVPLLSMIDTSTVGIMAGTAQLAALNPAIAVINYSSKIMVRKRMVMCNR
jgi:hypothetical protein